MLILARFSSDVKPQKAISPAPAPIGRFWPSSPQDHAPLLPYPNPAFPFKLSSMLRRVLLFWLILMPLVCLAAPSPNIILITLDSAPADRVGFMGGKRPTPNLDSLAKQGIVFERAYAQSPMTTISAATILTGTYPQTHQVTELGSPLGVSLPYLPALLRARNYRTAGFVGTIELDPKAGFAPGFDRGFGTFTGIHAFRGGEADYKILGRHGAQTVSGALQWLTANPNGPFFLWIHIYIPGGFSALTYDNNVTLTDVAVGQLLTVLRMRKLVDDAAIIVTATHGEGLGAHGEDTHGVFLYDETIHVPLLVKLPQNQLAAKRVPARVRLLDIAPTILEIAGAAVPSQMEGQSLLRIAKTTPTADQAVYSRTDFPHWAFGWSPLESWRVGKYLYVRAPKPELYDLSADPAAAHNLAPSSKATLDTIAAQLDAFDQHFKGGSKSEAGLTTTEMQKLASLGYVGIQKPSGASTTVAGTDPKDGIDSANKVQAAIMLIQNGEPAKAVPALQALANSLPTSYLAQYALGVAYAHTQQYPKAVEALHKAIQLQPDAPWSHFYMGTSLLKTGDFKTAVVHLEIASTRLPEFGEAHKALADAYDHLGRKDDAQRERARSGK